MLPNPFGVNPNRLKLVFASGLTNNAERIELFVTCAARDVNNYGLRSLPCAPLRASDRPARFALLVVPQVTRG